MNDKTVPGRADTPEKKREFIEKLYNLWNKFHDMRFAQLLVNFGPGITPNPKLYYVEDDKLIHDLEASSGFKQE